MTPIGNSSNSNHAPQRGEGFTYGRGTPNPAQTNNEEWWKIFRDMFRRATFWGKIGLLFQLFRAFRAWVKKEWWGIALDTAVVTTILILAMGLATLGIKDGSSAFTTVAIKGVLIALGAGAVLFGVLLFRRHLKWWHLGIVATIIVMIFFLPFHRIALWILHPIPMIWIVASLMAIGIHFFGPEKGLQWKWRKKLKHLPKWRLRLLPFAAAIIATIVYLAFSNFALSDLGLLVLVVVGLVVLIVIARTIVKKDEKNKVWPIAGKIVLMLVGLVVFNYIALATWSWWRVLRQYEEVFWGVNAALFVAMLLTLVTTGKDDNKKTHPLAITGIKVFMFLAIVGFASALYNFAVAHSLDEEKKVAMNSTKLVTAPPKGENDDWSDPIKVPKGVSLRFQAKDGEQCLGDSEIILFQSGTDESKEMIVEFLPYVSRE